MARLTEIHRQQISFAAICTVWGMMHVSDCGRLEG
jgi:hypothetical protein